MNFCYADWYEVKSGSQYYDFDTIDNFCSD